MQNRIFLFSNNRISVKEIIDNSDGLVLASKKYDSLSLKYKNSEIIPLNKQGVVIENENEIMAGFFIVSETYELLKYLYKKHKLLFMDQEYITLVSTLDPVKDYKYYTNIINEYTFECMLHMGIINSLNEIETHVYDGKPFFNNYVIEKSQIIKYRRTKWINIKSKIKNFLKKFINIFKK